MPPFSVQKGIFYLIKGHLLQDAIIVYAKMHNIKYLETKHMIRFRQERTY